MARRGGRGAAREMERSGGEKGRVGIGLLHNAEVERGEQRAVAHFRTSSTQNKKSC